MVVAELLDFPGVVSQGFELADARSMVASAFQDIARMYLEEGEALPVPNSEATVADADLIELVPNSEASRYRQSCPAGHGCHVNRTSNE